MAEINQVGVLALSGSFEKEREDLVKLIKEYFPQQLEVVDSTLSGFDLVDFISRKKHIIIISQEGSEEAAIGQVLQWKHSTGEGIDDVITISGKENPEKEIREALMRFGVCFNS